MLRGEVTVTGEDRRTSPRSCGCTPTGTTTPRREQLAKETVLKIDRAGSRLIGERDVPGGRQPARHGCC